LVTPYSKKGCSLGQSHPSTGFSDARGGKGFDDFPQLFCPVAAFTSTRGYAFIFAMHVEWNGTIHEIERRLTVQMLLDRFSLSKEAHLVAVNNMLVTEDCMIDVGDRVRIIRVISGG
jgi:sulfur carrier protein ThiS